MADAKEVLNEAKSRGVKGDGFEKIEKRLVGFKKETEVNFASNKLKEPPKEQLKDLINLYTQGLFQKTLDQGLGLLKDFPNSVDLYNIIGASNKDLGKLEEAIEAYIKLFQLILIMLMPITIWAMPLMINVGKRRQ